MEVLIEEDEELKATDYKGWEVVARSAVNE